MASSDWLGSAGEMGGGVLNKALGIGARWDQLADEDKDAMYQALMSLPEAQRAPVVAQLMGPSAMEGVHADPGAIDAERQALQKYLATMDTGGLGPQEKSQMLEAGDDAASFARGQRGATMQRYAAMGQGGGSGELADALVGDQMAANRLSRFGSKAAADAASRGLEAASGAGHLGGQIRGESFHEGSAKAQAADAIARFNAEAGNRVKEFNANMAGQDWERNAERAKLQAGAHATRAGQYGQKAGRDRGMLEGGGRALGGSIGGSLDFAQKAIPTNFSGFQGAPDNSYSRPVGGGVRPTLQDDENWYDKGY